MLLKELETIKLLHPKSCDIITYIYATGLEALIGYLDLKKKEKRT